MNWRLLPAAVGATTVAVAAAAIHAPGLLPVSPGEVDHLLAEADPVAVFLLLALLATGYALLSALGTRAVGSDVGPLVGVAPELPREGSTSVVAREFDAAFERGDRAAYLRAELHDAAVVALVQGTGLDRETAADAIASGEWTDDRRTAAFLGDGVEGPSPLTRVTDWIANEPRYRRYARHTVEAIERTWTADGGNGSD